MVADSGGEATAHWELTQQRYEAFLPRERVERVRRGKIEINDVPFFRGYLFVEFDIAADYWRPICSTRGVARLLGPHPERPTPVPVGVVEALRLRNGTDGVIDRRPSPERLYPLAIGSSVKVLDGPFADVTAIVSASSSKRVTLLLDLLGGRSVPVKLPREAVAAV